MSVKTIKYSQRLGDVLRCLPAAKHLADQGHEVFFDCLAQYHGVFDLTSYVKAGHRMGDVIDLEVWPNQYEAYRKSKRSWTDFVYSHPEIKDADKTNIILDKLDDKPAEGLPEIYNLVAAFGNSQGFYRNPLDIIIKARTDMGKDNFYVMTPPEIQIQGLSTYTAPSVSEMAKAIRGAKDFWAINSTPIILASVVRRGKPTAFFPQKNEWETDNIFDFEGMFRMD
jgi:hypothetical protein